MRNPLPVLLTLALAPFTITPTAALAPPTLLAPWRITSLSTHSPSGYPANHPYSRLAFTITDPNTITLGPTPFGDAAFPPHGANCSVVWMVYGASPLADGSVSVCGGGDDAGGGLRGRWTFEVVEGVGEGGGSATTDFGLRVRLEEAVVLGTGAVVNLRFEGEVAAFRVGENMAGACGGSSVCNWGLKKESVPVLVKQTLVEMECVAGDCDAEE